ncbi:hypothetical protein FC15_GL000269 [Lapidilactobacillus concavus DSM 17758]|uniref:Small integral membrane protein n=2 Tax=Lapidilactobacillus TaxID=2767884 RepID=A0A0R1VT37_9LACO|nr:hypothetical protein FC15_GL000269 [Lapidilactobacillus concavus DSM 17758]
MKMMKQSLTLGVFAGIVAVSWVAFGFWKMLFIILVILAGCSIGYLLELNQVKFDDLAINLLSKLVNKQEGNKHDNR